jgi:hypothetical protein
LTRAAAFWELHTIKHDSISTDEHAECIELAVPSQFHHMGLSTLETFSDTLVDDPSVQPQEGIERSSLSA